MNRRSFFGASAMVLFGGSHRRAVRRLDPRLTVRPRRPWIEPKIGRTRIGPDLPRGAILYVPESYSADTPTPLMVALHGSGGHAESWSRLFESCEEFGMVLLAPDSRGPTWDSIRGVFGADVAFIDATLRYTFERCNIDPTRLSLAGFSDGATYALSLGPSNGDLFTHLIAWSPGFSAPEEPIVGLPRVFVSHGTEDQVLSVNLSRHAIVPMFEMDGYTIEYLEFEGRHEIPPEALARSLEWFLE